MQLISVACGLNTVLEHDQGCTSKELPKSLRLSQLCWDNISKYIKVKQVIERGILGQRC